MQTDSSSGSDLMVQSIHELNHQSDQDVNIINDKLSQQAKGDPTKLFLLLTDQVAICISNMKLFYRQVEVYIKKNYTLKDLLEAKVIKSHDLTTYYKNCKMSAKMIENLGDIEKKYNFKDRKSEIQSLLQLAAACHER